MVYTTESGTIYTSFSIFFLSDFDTIFCSLYSGYIIKIIYNSTIIRNRTISSGANIHKIVDIICLSIY